MLSWARFPSSRRKASSIASLGQGAVNYDVVAAASIAPNSTGAAFDDYFAYNLTEPLTIRKNESALVPILQTKIDSERVTLWSPSEPTPLRALWITNTSNLTLDRGSFSIVEDGNFGGEGLLDSIHPREKRLLSYAVDQAVRVTTEGETIPNKVTAITASKGVLVLQQPQVTMEPSAPPRGAQRRAGCPDTVVIEHPVRVGLCWTRARSRHETTSGGVSLPGCCACGRDDAPACGRDVSRRSAVCVDRL